VSRRTTTDMTAAFLIGAVFGIGATLLLRLDPEDDKKEIVRLIRRMRRSRGRRGRPVRRLSSFLEDARDRW